MSGHFTIRKHIKEKTARPVLFCKFGGTENPNRSETFRTENPKSQNDCRKDHLKIKYLAKPSSPEAQKSIASTAFSGSYTVEAALALPLFIIVIIALYSLFGFMVLEGRMNAALNCVGKKLACYQYALERFQNEDGEDWQLEKSTLLEELGEDVSGFAVSETLVKRMVLSEEKVREAVEHYVKGGTGGLHFIGSQFDEDDQTVKLYVTYELEVPFFSILGARFSISEQSVHRAWTGKSPPEPEEEQIVFITEYGTVYHTSVSCNYLKLSIHSTSPGLIGSLRSKDGSVYQPCGICGNDAEGGVVYYTDYGDVYHYSRNCAGLKRTIQSVYLSQVNGRQKCKKCERRENE